MCICNPNIRSPYCEKCKFEFENKKERKINMLDLIKREIDQLNIEGLSCYSIEGKLHFDLRVWNNENDGVIEDYNQQVDAIKSIILDTMNTIRKGL